MRDDDSCYRWGDDPQDHRDLDAWLTREPDADEPDDDDDGRESPEALVGMLHVPAGETRRPTVADALAFYADEARAMGDQYDGEREYDEAD